VVTGSSDIHVVRFQDLGGLLERSEGYGIFIDCGDYRMNVGAILPLPDGKYHLNVMIMTDMQVPSHKCCDFTEFYDSVEDAIRAARAFLASQRK
jgi:hypothetical protein